MGPVAGSTLITSGSCPWNHASAARGVTVWRRLRTNSSARAQCGPASTLAAILHVVCRGLPFSIALVVALVDGGRMQIARTVLLIMALAIADACLWAQTAGEASAVMANSGVSAQISTPSRAAAGGADKRLAAPVRPRKGASASLIAPSGPPADEVNRKKFEENAGKNAGKVLFRSVPSGASIFLNHMLIGRTPLLLFVAPGKYTVQMRGVSEEPEDRVLAIGPKQSQTMVIDMKQQYPSSVSLRW